MASRIGSNNDNFENEEVVIENEVPVKREEKQNRHRRENTYSSSGRLSDLTSSVRGRACRSRAGEYLSRFHKTAQKVLEENEYGHEYSLVAVDGALCGLMFSSVNVVYEDTENKRIYAHTLYLAGSGDRPKPIQEEHMGTRIQVPQTAQDTWSERTFKVTKDFILSRLNTNFQFVYCGIQIVPSSVDATDEEIVRNVLSYAMEATFRNYENKTYPDEFFHLGKINHESNRFEILLDSSGEPEYTACNIPQRSDVKVILQVTGEDEYNRRTQPYPLTFLSANIEFFFNPETDDNRYGRRQQVFSKVWRAVCNINSVTTSKQLPYITDESVLFSLATANALAENNQWVGAVRKRTLRERNYDIGALAALASDTKMIAGGLNAPGISDDEFVNFIMDVTDEKLYYGLVVNEMGEQSWQMNNFIREAQDKSARSVLRSAANRLFMDNFYDFFPDDEPLLYDTGIRRLIGTITDNQGNLISLDNLDLVGFTTLAMNSNSTHAYNDVLDYIETFTPSWDANVQIATRTSILKDMFGDSLNIIGTASQLIFSADLFTAMANATAACNISIDRSSMSAYYNGDRRRGFADMFRGIGGMSANGGSKMFGTGGRSTIQGGRFNSRIY